MLLVPGYRRMQGLVFRPGDPRFAGRDIDDAIARTLADSACVMVNRGSGTRILIDALLRGGQASGLFRRSQVSQCSCGRRPSMNDR
jgi:putative molybdopterin biosynthesis protein